MRKWIQNVKRTVSERLENEAAEDLRRKISEQNPSKEPFKDDFSAEQKEIIRQQSDEALDKKMPERYGDVIEKAKFLVKLAIP